MPPMIAQPSDSIPTSTPLIEAIQAEIQALPPDRQQQVLDFVEFLAKKSQSQSSQKTIWQKMRERAARIPPQEWESMPIDGSYQHDHYLYGTPKREL
jgi:Protein of unknown function (DUF2281)